MEGRGGAGLRGEGRVRPSTATHTSPCLSSLLEPPELQHHVTWDLPGRGGGGGPRFFLTSCPPLPCTSREGVRSQRKIPLCFFFYVLFFVFLREVIFYSGFIPKEKHKPKKKMRASISIPPLFSLPPRNSASALKPKREPRRGAAFTKTRFCFSALPTTPIPGTP